MKHSDTQLDFTATLAGTEDVASSTTDPGKQPRDVRFWLVLLGIGISVMITALELVCLSSCFNTLL